MNGRERSLPDRGHLGRAFWGVTLRLRIDPSSPRHTYPAWAQAWAGAFWDTLRLAGLTMPTYEIVRAL